MFSHLLCALNFVGVSCLIFYVWILQPDTITGDIVFVLQLKEHPKFKRKYDDLYVEHTLSLSEALCGFQFALTHLDGRQLLIKSNPGEVIKPGMDNHIRIICRIYIRSFNFSYCCSTLIRSIQGNQ